MANRKPHGERIYGTYEPYPVTRGSGPEGYRDDTHFSTESHDAEHPDKGHEHGFMDLLGGAGPSDWSLPRPLQSEADGRLKPLPTLQSLFADRLDLMRAALNELRTAEDERRKLTETALEDIDSRIAECDAHLATFRSSRVLNDLERRELAS